MAYETPHPAPLPERGLGLAPIPGGSRRNDTEPEFIDSAVLWGE
jgi:hypothetical protein